jgi:hypothetical protein
MHREEREAAEAAAEEERQKAAAPVSSARRVYRPFPAERLPTEPAERLLAAEVQLQANWRAQQDDETLIHVLRQRLALEEQANEELEQRDEGWADLWEAEKKAHDEQVKELCEEHDDFF